MVYQESLFSAAWQAAQRLPMANSGSASEQHTTSLAVWDVASPLVASRVAKMKVGAKCSAGCRLTEHEVEVRDSLGIAAGRALLSPEPWPGTSGLYWAELEFYAPPATGTHTWTVASPHGEASSSFTFITVKPPEHTLTIRVREKGTTKFLSEVEVRLGVYRATTNARGLATVDLPKGNYSLSVWKIGYEGYSEAVEIKATCTRDLEISLETEVEQPYWM